MVVSVVREYKWSPDIIDNMYLDNKDYHGLEFWFEDCEKIHKQLTKK